MEPKRNLQPYAETLIVLAFLFIGPCLTFTHIARAPLPRDSDIVHKFTITTLKVVHRAWTPWDAARAWIFFLSLAALGLAAPWRAKMGYRWMLGFALGCWMMRFLFVTNAYRLANLNVSLEQVFRVNSTFAALWAILFTTAWVNVRQNVPKTTAVAVSISLFMTAYALTSLLYVFSYPPF